MGTCFLVAEYDTAGLLTKTGHSAQNPSMSVIAMLRQQGSFGGFSSKEGAL